MILSFILLIFLAVFIFIIVSYYIQRNLLKTPKIKPFVSFIIPTYNDAKYITSTIKSIYQSYNPKNFEIFIINDCSKDNTLQVLKNLSQYNFHLINNKENKGKVRSINSTFPLTKGEIIFMLDSDTILNKRVMEEIIFRLSKKDVGGVSSGYKPINNGFLPFMQGIEYGMLRLIQLAYNPFSTVSFWGGCMAIKRNIFKKVGLLSEYCLVEDGDLALKIGDIDYKANECLHSVYSYVPSTIPDWIKQKIRWSAGGIQNFIHHYKFFLKHPIVIFFLLSYLSLGIVFAISFFNNLIYLDNFYSIFESLRNTGISFFTSLSFANKATIGIDLVNTLISYLLFPLFSLPYLFMNYPETKKEPLRLIGIFPYSIIYLPAFALICFIGGIKGIYKTITLKHGERGW